MASWLELMTLTSHPLRHVAIIMDGNNRWAKRRGMPGPTGHKAGVERIRDVMAGCKKHGVEVLTLFAFSSENWQRPPREVEALMTLFLSYLKKEARALAEEGVRLKIVGDRQRFSERVRKAMDAAEAIAAEGRTTLVIAADYGGKWDITQAARRLADEVASGRLASGDITEQHLANRLSLAGFPDVDLLIRTGGELRISNFMLWQSAYAELYFTDTLWPDFDESALDRAVADFHRRQRRFGKTSEQVEQLERESRGA